jgi:hypothetical protein
MCRLTVAANAMISISPTHDSRKFFMKAVLTIVLLPIAAVYIAIG